jgi:isopentenyl phosphate kinase
MKHSQLIFLKLGGSLITVKDQPMTPRVDVIKNISQEIAKVVQDHPDINLVIGHGSGSYGHTEAAQHQTQSGGQGKGFWRGFSEVWKAARELNQIIVKHLSEAGLPIIAFPPSAGVIADNQKIISWDIEPLQSALTHHLIPLIQGDVIFDQTLGGTILSTEQFFAHLAELLHPQRILLAGLEAGVYKDPMKPEDIIKHITPSTFSSILPNLSGAQTPDVTGGMSSKVKFMLSLLAAVPDVTIQIFSGLTSGCIAKALAGAPLGTIITSEEINHKP